MGWYQSQGSVRRATWGYIETTQDNASNWITASSIGSNSNGGTSSTTHANLRVSTLFDVTNTSTHKCRFRVYATYSINVWGSTDVNNTNVVFMKLGET